MPLLWNIFTYRQLIRSILAGGHDWSFTLARVIRFVGLNMIFNCRIFNSYQLLETYIYFQFHLAIAMPCGEIWQLISR